jgi:hypothetical protein
MPDNHRPTQPFPVALLEFRPLHRNSLCGFARLRLGRTLLIADCPAHNTAGRKWVGLPAKPLLDANGTALRDERGKVRYAPILEWSDRATGEAFSQAAVRIIEAQHPSAFAATAPPSSGPPRAPAESDWRRERTQPPSPVINDLDDDLPF